MSISLFIIALVPLLMAPIYTYEGYQELYEREAAHIAVDNAGIILGRNDRDLFNHLILSNQIASGMEAAHHKIHFIAKIPVIGVPLIPFDQALEKAIEVNHVQAKLLAQMTWKFGTVKVVSEFYRFSVAMEGLERDSMVPLKEKRCAKCGATPYWEVSSVPVRSQIIGNSNEPKPQVFVELTGKSLMHARKWNYRMLLE